MLPEAEPRRKRHRFGLFGPFVVLLVLIGAWSYGWYWLRGQTETQMDAAAARIKTSGGELTWQSRTIGGYPFRMDVTLTGVKAADPSGWAIRAQELKGEAYAYQLNHWVVVAPQGVVFTRPDMVAGAVSQGAPGASVVVTASQPGVYVPQGGDVIVTGQALRASIVADGGPFPRIAVEGANLTFSTPQGAGAFWMQSVEKLNFRLNPGPNDQGAILLHLGGAKARLTGLVARIAQDKPVEVEWDSVFSKASTLKGGTWPLALKSWQAAGGVLTVDPASRILAGDALFAVKGGQLALDLNGALQGRLNVELRQAPRALAAMGEAGTIAPDVATAAAVSAADAQDASQTMQADIVFQDGQAKLGPLPLTQAPRFW